MASKQEHIRRALYFEIRDISGKVINDEYAFGKKLYWFRRREGKLPACIDTLHELPLDQMKTQLCYFVNCYGQDLDSPLLKELGITQPVNVEVMYVW